MENKINLFAAKNPYLHNFSIAQVNLSKLIAEERLKKRIERSRKEFLKLQ